MRGVASILEAASGGDLAGQRGTRSGEMRREIERERERRRRERRRRGAAPRRARGARGSEKGKNERGGETGKKRRGRDTEGSNLVGEDCFHSGAQIEKERENRDAKAR